MIDGHGDDIYRYGGKISLNFSSNIFQEVCHTHLKSYLASCIDVISNYPEAAPYSVENMLTRRLRLPPDHVMVTNGATDAIHIIARAFQGCYSAILQPTFAEYADACRMSRHQLLTLRNIDDIPENADLVWICNPNNPTGKALPSESLRTIISHHPDTIFVIDQAYYLYTRCSSLSTDDVLLNDNLILIYSMTKDYAVPGLRLGYVVGNSEIIAYLGRYRAPWSVNALAIEGAKYLLSSRAIDVNLDELLSEVKRISEAFRNMGIDVAPSDTNFVLCCLHDRCANDLKDYLAVNHGILIRDASNFEGLSPGHFRIAAQSHEKNDKLINAVRQWMRS